MARSHTMTPARRAALKKAQAASARKRRGRGRAKTSSKRGSRLRTAAKIAGVGVGSTVALGAGLGLYLGAFTGSKKSMMKYGYRGAKAGPQISYQLALAAGRSAKRRMKK